MSSKRDLTRWNRAGLSRFRYVGGNAVTHLEVLRKALAERFPEWQELTTGVPGDPDGETVNDRLDRLSTQYQAERRDWLWEIGRGLARAGHVLTEHLDAYANEGFLGTAVRWDNVRRLVEMLDYHPAPPASAATSLVLEAKDSGVVGKGFGVKHSPPDGGPPVLFETLDDNAVDPDLNALRLAGHDRSPDSVTGSTLTLEGQLENLVLGRPAVLENESSGKLEARLLTGVSVLDTTTEITLSEPDLPAGWTAGWTKVHLDPADRLAPVGPAVGNVESVTSLQLEDSPGVPLDVVYISDGTETYFREITQVDGRQIDFGQSLAELDLRTAYVSRARQLTVAAVSGAAIDVVGDLSALRGALVAGLDGDGSLLSFDVSTAEYDIETGLTTLTLVGPTDSLADDTVLFAPPVQRDFEVDSFLEGSKGGPPPTQLDTAIPKKTSAGDLAVILRKTRMAWGRLTNVADVEAGTAELSVDTWQDSGGGGEPFYLKETTVYGHFRQSVRLAGWQENDTPVSGSCFQDPQATGSSCVALEASIPEALVKGRTILLEQAAGGTVHEAEVVSKDADLGTFTISPAVKLVDGFTVGNTVIRANLVLAGHGESRRERILGSGDATVSYASFLLEQEEISYVADSTQPSGVRADLTLRVKDRVGDRTWQQVATLRDSKATDRHYTARQTEDGYIKIGFGDGRNGQRLATGTNNVRAAFRVGAGLAGNVAAGSLVKAVRPDRLIDSVRQPIAASGGNEREDVAALRENAPASVLALERAVSLSDFARLAAGHSSLWQANAFVVTHGGEASPIRPDLERVEVVAVPAGGGALGSLAETIREYLAAHTLPGIEVVVSPYETVPLEIEAIVQVKSAEVDPEEVLGNVRAALFTAFSLRRRKLGQDLFLSDLYAVVEEVSGVESSRCVLDGDATLLRLPASPRAVIYLDPDADQVALESQEFEL